MQKWLSTLRTEVAFIQANFFWRVIQVILLQKCRNHGRVDLMYETEIQKIVQTSDLEKDCAEMRLTLRNEVMRSSVHPDFDINAHSVSPPAR